MIKILGYDESKLKEIGGYITAKEIRQQPRLWRETFKLVKKNKEKINYFLEEVLKENDLRIIFTGAGTSAYIGDSIVPYLNRKLDVKAEAIATTDIVANPKNYLHSDKPTLLISCARSGNSPESIAAVELAEKFVDNLYQIFLICNPEGDLTEKASQDDKSLLLLMPEDSNDQGFAMTGSFTCMLLASLLIFHIDHLKNLEPGIQQIIEDGEKILEENIYKIKDIVSNNFNRVVFLGSSTLMGVARESALKTLELTSGKVITNWESSLGFRHGPKSVINDRTLVFSYLSNDNYTRKYEVDMLKEMVSERGGKKVIAISSYQDEEIDELVDYFISINKNESLLKDDVYSVFNYILIVHMFTLFKSIKLGISSDNPCPDGTVNRVVKGVTIYPY